MIQEKQLADSNLAFINQQLAGLKERMTKEQKRLNKLLEKKEKKIQCQSVIIQKMKTLIELQKCKIKMEDFSTPIIVDQFEPSPNPYKPVPTIIIEDTNLLHTTNNNLVKHKDTDHKDAKGHPVNLKRQTALIKKGSERPKFTTITHHFQSSKPIRSSISCQNLSYYQTKPKIPSRANVNAKLYNTANHKKEPQPTKPSEYSNLQTLHSDDDSGHWSLDNNRRKQHALIRTDSYEKALELDPSSCDDHQIKTASKPYQTYSYGLHKFASQPHLCSEYWGQ